MHTLRHRALLVSVLGLALSGSSAQMNPSASPLFTASTVSRAQKLLGQMSTEEKIGQMTQMFVFDPNAANDAMLTDRIKAGRLGSALFVTDPVLINALQHVAVENSRLHIPLIFGFDVIHGFKTIFPVPLAMAASWDPEGAVRAQTVAAAEARSVGIGWAFAPMIDIARDPRWGRIVEGAGEDPYLGAAMARGQVRGFQGPAIGTPDHVLACAKHFAGYGAAEGGRDYDASYISDAQMQNIYLPPFHAAVEAGVGSLMSAYMDLNDIPATGNKFLMTDTLRTQWGFKGFVVSDADAVKSLEKHGFASDPEDAATRALNAGLNMEMALNTPAFDTLQVALAEHRITLPQIDAAVLPILEAKIQLGLFEHPYADIPRSQQVLANPAHRVEALHAAERSAVLLRNEGELLPLAKGKYKTIAVIGPTGDSGPEMTGSWTFIQDDAETVTIAAGLRSKFGNDAQVTFAPGVQIKRNTASIFDEIFHTPKPEPGSPNGPWNDERAQQEFDKALALARNSNLVILTLGELRLMSGEQASRSSLDLPGDQEKLLKAVAALGKPVVLVLSNGRPLNIVWANGHIPAILEAWYPGTQGGTAIANLLTGDVVPGGKLPLAWPRNVGQIPINYAHNLTQDASKQAERYWNEPSTPLYPFGYGLSYSTFAFSNLQAASSQTNGATPSLKPAVTSQSVKGQVVQVSVDVENSGTVAADEVVQLYIHQQSGRASRPVRELKGFRRISLAPHEKQTLHFTLGSPELRYWNAASRSWVEDPGTFDLWVGGDSAASLHTTFNR